MLSIRSSLTWAEQRLATESQLLETARADSYWLLAHVLKKDQAWLRTWPEAPICQQDLANFKALIERRLKGEPVAYLTGRQGFWSLDLRVTPTTLVPRPETELLVEQALMLLPEENAAQILDLGTGSGAIALALKKERPLSQVTATDVDPPSVQLAAENARNHGLDITFYCGFWFEAIPRQLFDLIVSNPPYIVEGDEHLQGPGVQFEPLRALVSGRDGLDDIRKIIDQCPGYLNQNGWLLLEHGYDQANAVRQQLMRRGFQQVRTELDLAGHERVTMGQWCHKVMD